MTAKIMVVDDEPDIRHEIVECLTEEGYECIEAPGMNQALEILRADPDVSTALVDIRMPGKTGLDLIAAVQTELDGKVRDVEFIILAPAPTTGGPAPTAPVRLRVSTPFQIDIKR